MNCCSANKLQSPPSPLSTDRSTTDVNVLGNPATIEENSKEDSKENSKQASLNLYLSQEFPKVLTQHESPNVGKSLIDWLRNNDIKLLAVDFDLTMLTVHSGGWIDCKSDSQTYRKVLSSLSTSFIDFAKTAQSDGLILCVVTFADSNTIPSHLKSTSVGGEELVNSVIEASGNPFSVDSIYALYPRNYQNPGSYKALQLESAMTHTKSYHLRKIREKYGLQASQIVLIDDSIINCIQAVLEGYVTINVSGKFGFEYSVLKGVVLK